MQCARAGIVFVVLCLAASTGLAQRSAARAPAPAACSTVAQTAADANLTTLLAAVQAANLTSVLSDPTLKFTVFAPTNDAFAGTLQELGLTAPQLLASPNLTPILSNHLLSYPLTAADLIGYGTVKSNYNQSPLNITATTVGSDTIVEVATPLSVANVIKSDILACESIVHVVDDVLLPVIS